MQSVGLTQQLIRTQLHCYFLLLHSCCPNQILVYRTPLFTCYHSHIIKEYQTKETSNKTKRMNSSYRLNSNVLQWLLCFCLTSTFSHFELSSAKKALKDADTMQVDTLPWKCVWTLKELLGKFKKGFRFEFPQSFRKSFGNYTQNLLLYRKDMF